MLGTLARTACLGVTLYYFASYSMHGPASVAILGQFVGAG